MLLYTCVLLLSVTALNEACSSYKSHQFGAIKDLFIREAAKRECVDEFNKRSRNGQVKIDVYNDSEPVGKGGDNFGYELYCLRQCDKDCGSKEELRAFQYVNAHVKNQAWVSTETNGSRLTMACECFYGEEEESNCTSGKQTMVEFENAYVQSCFDLQNYKKYKVGQEEAKTKKTQGKKFVSKVYGRRNSTEDHNQTRSSNSSQLTVKLLSKQPEKISKNKDEKTSKSAKKEKKVDVLVSANATEILTADLNNGTVVKVVHGNDTEPVTERTTTKTKAKETKVAPVKVKKVEVEDDEE